MTNEEKTQLVLEYLNEIKSNLEECTDDDVYPSREIDALKVVIKFIEFARQ